jgi:N-acetylglucosamine-6-phosphate deacetylase
MENSDNKPILLNEAKVILPDGDVGSRSLLLEDGLITRITERPITQASVTKVKVDGLTVLPGFIDIHIHGAVGVDTMTATAEDLRRVSQFLAAQGVTAWLPTLVPGSDSENANAINAIDDLMAQQERGPAVARAIGVHYEGPFVNPDQCGALRKQFFRTYKGDSDLDSLPVPKADGAVRMTTLAPEVQGGIDLIRNLRKREWIVSIGHTKAGIDVLERAREAGARHITHFMNAMPSLHHRSPGPVGWALMRDDVTLDIIADGVHVDPLVVQLVLRSKGVQRVALISDAVAPAGLGDGEYHLWDETITVSEGRTRNERGSIAGSVISLLDARRLVRSFGLADVDLARLTSTNAAEVLGIESDYGSIAEGKRADLVGIDDSGSVKLTIVGGRVAFERQ